MTLLSELVEQIDPITISTPLSDVLKYFRNNKSVILAPVTTEDGMPLGIIRERDLKEYVYSPFGKEILLNESIKRGVEQFLVSCSICDINTNIDSIIKLFSSFDNRDGITVMKDSLYFGFLSASSILKILGEKRVEEKFSNAIDSLVVGIAHEINTPLGISITANSFVTQQIKELLVDIEEKKIKKSEMEEKLRNFIEATESISNNLNRVANLTSLLKKVSVNRHYEDIREIRVFDAVMNARELIEIKFGKTEHEIIIDCPLELKINTYSELFMEIIINLLENSIEHAFPDGKKGSIILSFEVRGDYLVFTCQDDGIGVSLESKEKMFEPFFTTKRNKGKLGLGLNIVSNILRNRLSGNITSESTEGKGTKFIVDFPI